MSVEVSGFRFVTEWLPDTSIPGVKSFVFSCPVTSDPGLEVSDLEVSDLEV